MVVSTADDTLMNPKAFYVVWESDVVYYGHFQCLCIYCEQRLTERFAGFWSAVKVLIHSDTILDTGTALNIIVGYVLMDGNLQQLWLVDSDIP